MNVKVVEELFSFEKAQNVTFLHRKLRVHGNFLILMQQNTPF